MLARLFGDRSLSFFGDLSRFLCLLGLHPCCLSVMLFSLWVEELSFLDIRASSPFMYFSALASTSAMLSYGFLDMENIKSFDCTPNPVMNAVIANFSSGTSTFSSGHMTSGFPAGSVLWLAGDNPASCMFSLQ